MEQARRSTLRLRFSSDRTTKRTTTSATTAPQPTYHTHFSTRQKSRGVLRKGRRVRFLSRHARTRDSCSRETCISPVRTEKEREREERALRAGHGEESALLKKRRRARASGKRKRIPVLHFLGNEKETSRAQLWSVGIVLFVLLAGAPSPGQRKCGAETFTRRGAPRSVFRLARRTRGPLVFWARFLVFSRVVVKKDGTPGVQPKNSNVAEKRSECEFAGPVWAQISDDAKHVVRRLAAIDAAQRPTADAALQLHAPPALSSWGEASAPRETSASLFLFFGSSSTRALESLCITPRAPISLRLFFSLQSFGVFRRTQALVFKSARRARSKKPTTFQRAPGPTLHPRATRPAHKTPKAVKPTLSRSLFPSFSRALSLLLSLSLSLEIGRRRTPRTSARAPRRTRRRMPYL